MIQVLPINSGNKLEWDKYVNKSPSGTFYHLYGWKSVLEKTFGFKPIYLFSTNKTDEINGILPLFLMRDILGKKYLISNPSSDYAGVCADDNEIEEALINRAIEIAVERKVQYLEIRQLSGEGNALQSKKDYVTMFLRLDSDEENIWKKTLNTKARNQVRKAYKSGLSIDFGKQYLNDFYKVVAANFRDLGTPIYPKYFFSNILEEFNDSTGLIVVRYQDKVIGGMLFICCKDTFIDPCAASMKQYNRLCPNNILYWEAIKYACNNGFKYFDLGRSAVDSGTFKFKKQWGAQPVQLDYQYYLNKTAEIPDANPDNNKYQSLISLWKKLPLTVANNLGPRLIKFLPEA